MRAKHFPCIVIAAAVLLGCSHKEVECRSDKNLDHLKSLTLERAIQNADLAYVSGDKRLLGIHSVGLDVPALSGNPDAYRYGIKIVEGTTDTVCNDQERSLMDNAREYSKRYNQEILKKMTNS